MRWIQVDGVQLVALRWIEADWSGLRWIEVQ